MLRHRLALRPRHALALGLLQGPTELLPVSSSAHTILVPLLAGWPYGELEAQLRKSFEVALHAGTALALALDMRAELAREAARLNARRALVVAIKSAQSLNVAPPVATAISISLGNVAVTLSGAGPRFSILLNLGYSATTMSEPSNNANTTETMVRMRVIA